jgi:plastocyanin
LIPFSKVKSGHAALDGSAASRNPRIAASTSGKRVNARWLAVITAVFFIAANGVISTPLRANKVVSVDQITDLGATGTTRMFRFVPNLVELEVGEQLTILNSTANHTVHTIPEIWPKGAPVVKISHAKVAKVSFDRAGYYGFTCRRHGTYGMVMLVVVGKPGASNPGQEQSIDELATSFRGSEKARAAFLALVEKYRASANR